MLKIVDRTLAVMLMVGAGVGHTLGSIKTYGHDPMELLWALNASGLGVLLGALHLYRSTRQNDRALAFLLAGATAFWVLSSARFGQLIGNPLDPRVVFFILISLGLIGFCLRNALGRSPMDRAGVRGAVTSVST